MSQAEPGPVTEPEVADDAALLAWIRSDPARGVPAVVGRYEAPLLRHVGAVLDDPSAAQDVVQESFLRLLANGRRIENLSAWLHRVAHNLAIDHLRRESRLRKLHRAAAPPGEPTTDAADQELDCRESRALVQDALAGLTPNQRAVVFLKVKEGRSYKEIAQATGLTPSNVGYLLHHALKKLAAALDPPAGKGAVR
jgi:RNA polymerase sigma-70 factor (ECF subfamily)